MELTIRPMTAAGARVMASWQYPAPYAIYTLPSPPTEEEMAYYLDPAMAYHEMLDETGVLVGFCSFGKDGQVPGGDYSDDALDIGMGVRPDLTGQGLGQHFASVVVEFACSHYAPSSLRVTIAAFNTRAQRLWQRLGFQPTSYFCRPNNELPFIIFVRAVAP